MLGMIEVNLLPAEYRAPEGGGTGFLVTVIAGFAVCLVLFMFLRDQQRQLSDLTFEGERLGREKADLEVEAKKVDRLQEEILEQKARQDTIIEISQSKVMWSQKLEQLSRIMSSFKTFWVNRVTLTKSAKGSVLSLQTQGLGGNLSEVARLRDALKDDANFFYHFGELENRAVNKVDLQDRYRNANEKMEFEIKLPLKLGR